MRRSLFLSATVAALLLISGGAAQAADCPDGFTCSRVPVPLDRSGQVPGTVGLSVARQDASRHDGRPLLIVVSGGPGQAGARSAAHRSSPLKPVLKRYQLVGMDVRGTGRSDLVDCPALQVGGGTIDELTTLYGDCAGRLGDRAGLYSTAATVEDIDAVRAALGADKVALMGTSYGTHVIQRYALAHPDRLDRAVLNSPVAPGGPQALQLNTFGAMPRVLRALAPDAVAQTQRLVRRLARRPLTGRLPDGAGRRTTVRMTSGADLAGVLLAGDSSAVLRSQYPAAVRAANAGWPAPLLRLSAVVKTPSPIPATSLSAGAYAAAVCADLTMPWAQSSDPATRPALFAASVAAVPESAATPFDRSTVRDLAVSAPCRAWPAIPTGPDTAPARYPDVPVLILSGLSDLRTPVESARAVQAIWPGAGLVTMAGTGHDVLSGDASGCVARLTVRFLGGAPASSRRCPGTNGFDAALARFPTRLRDLAPVGGSGRPAREFAAALATFRDAQAIMFELSGRPGHFGGLRGGGVRWTLEGGDPIVHLRDYAYLPGIRVSGTFDYHRVRARLTVRGRVRGSLAYDEGWTGHFGGRTLLEHR